VLKSGLHQCPHCCRAEVYLSRPEGIREEIMFLLLLRPVRCGRCIARFYLPLLVPTPLNPKRRAGVPK
jgi:hypothetical protein